ncbi:hypothetical protein ZHAS_00013089 [Anopheles sinensis]|uniref:Uncharacterized protein n=1 Tax=Anopheles sinensis TaxID=74873 RepID=A0A084W4V7_ANOSI|nr:hypothetical protein ZHAS_00013089 [Anopheles sinensis]
MNLKRCQKEPAEDDEDITFNFGFMNREKHVPDEVPDEDGVIYWETTQVFYCWSRKKEEVLGWKPTLPDIAEEEARPFSNAF